MSNPFMMSFIELPEGCQVKDVIYYPDVDLDGIYECWHCGELVDGWDYNSLYDMCNDCVEKL